MPPGDDVQKAYFVAIGQFWSRVLDALQRLLAFLIFAVAHKLVTAAMIWSTPKDWMIAAQWAEAVVWVVFVAVYAYLGWDMLTVFMPWLSGKKEQ